MIALAAIRGLPGAWAAVIALPLATWQIVLVRRVTTNTRPWRYHWLTLGAIGLMGLTSALWLAGMTIVLLRGTLLFF